MLKRIKDFLFPHICPICQRELVNPALKICDDCFALFPKLTPFRCKSCGGPLRDQYAPCGYCSGLKDYPWQVAVSAFPFEGFARTAIHKYKYRKHLNYAPFFANQMAENWKLYAKDFTPDVVVPIPLHWFRHMTRGYNQAAEVARLLAKSLDIPCKKLLKRQRKTKVQAKLDAKNRLKNLLNAFKSQADDLEHQNILLVDDVFTTGSTLQAATQELLEHNAGNIAVITIARDL